MSEQSSTEAATSAETGTIEAADDAALGESGQKALVAERAARKAADKALAEATKRLDAIEQASLTELEKAQRAAADAESKLVALTREATVSRVALAKGVPADLVEFLTGDTEDEIAAKADVLIQRLAVAPTPRPDPSQGSTGASALNGDGIESALKNALGIA